MAPGGHGIHAHGEEDQVEEESRLTTARPSSGWRWAAKRESRGTPAIIRKRVSALSNLLAHIFSPVWTRRVSRAHDQFEHLINKFTLVVREGKRCETAANIAIEGHNLAKKQFIKVLDSTAVRRLLLLE